MHRTVCRYEQALNRLAHAHRTLCVDHCWPTVKIGYRRVFPHANCTRGHSTTPVAPRMRRPEVRLADAVGLGLRSTTVVGNVQDGHEGTA
jgi:hypothetical protein